MNIDDDTTARIVLLHAAEPGTRPLTKFVQRYGAVEALDRILHGQGPGGSPESLARKLGTVSINAVLDRLHEVRCEVVTPASAHWPARVDDLGDTAPLALLVRGALSVRVAALRSCAVVGARAATEYGNRVASNMAADLADAGLGVVSGAAFGIDAAAHRGALASGGSTIAVIASGIDIVYPAAHETLFAELLDHGAVVSETPPGRRPTRAGFLARNRLIAALTAGTVVVEAAHRSGALNTATWASDLTRHVMAVPGPVTATTSDGCHRLIRDHVATLVTSARDVLEQLGYVSLDVKAEAADRPDEVLDTLSPTAALVYEQLPVRGGVSTETLATATALTNSEVVSALGQLLLCGAARQGSAGWSAVPGLRGTPGRRP